MKFLKKYYIYAIELILGNILFNTVYALVTTLTFHKIGATNETFINNIISSFGVSRSCNNGSRISNLSKC